MKAASKSAIGDASGVIIKSICTENGLHGEYMLDQAVCAPASPTEAQKAIEALEMALAILEASMKSRIMQTRKRRNDFLPINRLPVEMVVEIFHHVLDSDALCPPTTTPYLARLKTLASVCSAWRRLVSGTPSLWAVLESTCPSAFLPIVIRKAKGSLLNVRCAAKGGYTRSFYWGEATAFLRSIIPLANKWATLYLDPIMYTERMPNLQKAWCQGNGILVARPFGGPTPRLRELRLHNVSIDWSFVELRDLLVLVLVTSNPPSISRLLAVLERSPKLELMELRDSKVDTTDTPSAIPTIILPRLRDLTLSNMNHQAVSTILRSIHTSTFRTFVLDSGLIRHDRDPPCPNLNHDLEHLVPAIKCALTEGKAVDVAFNIGAVEVTVKGETNRACFRFRATIDGSPHLQSHLAWLKSNVDFKSESTPTIQKASVFFRGGTILESSIYLQVFQWIPNIVELSIETYEGASELIQHLTERIRVGEEVEWRCPRLRTVRFCGYPTALEDVLEFARRRYGDRPIGGAVDKKEELTIHWPDALHHLDVEGVEDLDYDTMEEPKDITGCTDIAGYEGREPASPEDSYEEGYGYSDEDSLGSMDLYDIFALVGQ
ncbi:hypothetical protein FS837_003901 [Tulasnella sp. UAMH 9824]|nr:hypothetical protein FS837_003901 [Tulasnella sp. UAMH 9824]